MKQLTPKEHLFCEAYARPESESYNNGKKAAEFAGYDGPNASRIAYDLKNKPHIRARLDKIYAENAVGIGEVITNLKNDRRLAIEKNDIQAAVRCDELMGKRHGAFVDKTAVVETEQRQLSKREAEAERRMAALMIREGLMNDLDTPKTEAELKEISEGEPAITEAERKEIQERNEIS